MSDEKDTDLAPEDLDNVAGGRAPAADFNRPAGDAHGGPHSMGVGGGHEK